MIIVVSPQSKMVDLGGYVIILVETNDKRVKLYGSPADKADLEVVSILNPIVLMLRLKLIVMLMLMLRLKLIVMLMLMLMLMGTNEFLVKLYGSPADKPDLEVNNIMMLMLLLSPGPKDNSAELSLQTRFWKSTS